MTLEESVKKATQEGITLGCLAVRLESEETGISEEGIRARIRHMVSVMRESVKEGFSDPDRRSRSSLSGGDAAKVLARVSENRAFPGNSLIATAVAYALSVGEVNAQMGRIVAAPTAGSCGVIPGAFLALGEALKLDDEELADALCAAGLVGQSIANRASLSGAQGGCQAVCGSAAAMAAAGLVQLAGGSPEACIHAAALSLKALMGLVCDPVGGLVEVPCIKRNAASAAVAIASAEMALSGVRSKIPPDEVISAMAQVGRMMPASLKETSQAGLAVTPSASKLCPGQS